MALSINKIVKVPMHELHGRDKLFKDKPDWTGFKVVKADFIQDYRNKERVLSIDLLIWAQYSMGNWSLIAKEGGGH